MNETVNVTVGGKYLVQYTCDGEPCVDLLTVNRLANLIGFQDCNECGNFRIYRLHPDRNPEPLDYHAENCMLYLFPELPIDGLVSMIDFAAWDEH